jgi:Heterokaryon incompatibility protein (HET)
MRLLRYNEKGEFSLTESFGNQIPKYAILSHTWGAEEVTFKDLIDGTGKGKAGYSKIQFCGKQARRDGLQYFWVDTCCIDKSSSTELAEAINSMFQWYSRAVKCYAYLSDVSAPDHDEHQGAWESDFRNSRWFTRGWTLQELIAPTSVEFFSSDGKRLGDRENLVQQIQEITGIASGALQGVSLNVFSVGERFSWAANRRTTREEDKLYCLLGIFGVHLPLIYGEGENNALNRLKTEIAKASTGKALPCYQCHSHPQGLHCNEC